MSHSTSTTGPRSPLTLGTAAHVNSRDKMSAVARVPAVTAVPERRVDPAADDKQTGTAARWGLGLVYAMVAYEWLLAGLNKDLSGTFRSGLANRIHGSLVGNPHGWYISFVEWAVLPHVGVFSVAVEIGELLVASGLIWGAVLWVRPEWFSGRLRSWLGIAISVALLGSAVMELNYYLLAGHGWPWLTTSDPFVEGLSVDGLVLLISLALIPVQLIAARQSSAGDSVMAD